MKSRIANQLNSIEIENDVSILYACESCSRAGGFDNTESDYDVRFLYKLEVMSKNFPKKGNKIDLKMYDGRFFEIILPNFEAYFEGQE